MSSSVCAGTWIEKRNPKYVNQSEAVLRLGKSKRFGELESVRVNKNRSSRHPRRDRHRTRQPLGRAQHPIAVR